MTDYRYPYLPPNRCFKYAPASNYIMRIAMRYARLYSADTLMPNATVLVSDGRPIAAGANGSDYHRLHGCVRQATNSVTGEDYHLCEGCHPSNHSERRAIGNALKQRLDLRDADLYLWGHFGSCPECWNVMIAASIRDVYLLEDAEKLFNKKHPKNIIGFQFAIAGSQL